MEPKVRRQLEETIHSLMESREAGLRKLVAEAKLSSRLLWMVRLENQTYIDQNLVTNVEYQLFLDEMRQAQECYCPDHWTDNIFLLGEARSPWLEYGLQMQKRFGLAHPTRHQVRNIPDSLQ